MIEQSLYSGLPYSLCHWPTAATLVRFIDSVIRANVISTFVMRTYVYVSLADYEYVDLKGTDSLDPNL